MSYLSKWSSNKKTKVSSASSFWADEWSTYDDEMFTESYYDAETDSFQTKKKFYTIVKEFRRLLRRRDKMDVFRGSKEF